MDAQDDELNRAGEDPASTTAVTAWVERLLGRSLGDVRVHDSRQAGALARRLGARAFTIGRDVYVQPELLRAPGPQGAALLAHELTHAVEQAGAPPAAPPPPATPSVPRRGTAGPLLTVSRRPVAVQREVPGGADSEAQARAVEAAALGAQSAPPQRRPAPPDPEAVADLVYRRMVTELRIENERNARGW